jgi:hypothetical protein
MTRAGATYWRRTDLQKPSSCYNHYSYSDQHELCLAYGPRNDAKRNIAGLIRSYIGEVQEAKTMRGTAPRCEGGKRVPLHT